MFCGQAAEIYSRRDRLPLLVQAVPDEFVAALFQTGIEQGAHFLAAEVVDVQGGGLGLFELEAEGGAGGEGIGESAQNRVRKGNNQVRGG